MMRLFILSFLFMATNMLTAQERYMLVGTYTKGKSEGIYVYKFNTSTGDLQKTSSLFIENPSYLALTKDKKYVYTANENGKDKGGVTAFSFDASTGKLTRINEQPSNGDGPCYIAVDNSDKWVAVGNYSGGNFSVYPIQEDGGVGAAAQIIQHTGSSVNKSRQESPHVHSTVFSPDGKYLAVVDLGTDKIMVYPFDAASNKPVNEKAIEVSAKPGSGPRHIVFHPTLPFAYVIEEMSGYVTAYEIKDGTFNQIQTINSHPQGYKGAIGSAAIKVSGDGKFVYASNRGESNTIAVFSVDAKSGKLKTKGIAKSGGNAPRDFTIDPTDNYLLSANGGSDNITIFKRDRKGGTFKETGKQESIPSPVCIVFL